LLDHGAVAKFDSALALTSFLLIGSCFFRIQTIGMTQSQDGTTFVSDWSIVPVDPQTIRAWHLSNGIVNTFNAYEVLWRNIQRMPW
jgi:hypothetical protein